MFTPSAARKVFRTGEAFSPPPRAAPSERSRHATAHEAFMEPPLVAVSLSWEPEAQATGGHTASWRSLACASAPTREGYIMYTNSRRLNIAWRGSLPRGLRLRIPLCQG